MLAKVSVQIRMLVNRLRDQAVFLYPFFGIGSENDDI